MDQRNISSDYDVLLDLVKSRASVRKLKPDPIPEEYVTQILEVGRWAMSGANVGLGSGPGLGFRAKGAPAIGVAAMYGPPANLALVLPFASPIRTLADLKGKRIGVTTAGSLTDWLVRELSRQQGWGSDGIQIVALGQMQARLAAIQRGELDGMVIEAATGYELEEAGKAKNFMLFGDIAKDFYTHGIFATDDLIEKRPDLLRRFLRGWFKTIAFMRANT